MWIDFQCCVMFQWVESLYMHCRFIMGFKSVIFKQDEAVHLTMYHVPYIWNGIMILILSPMLCPVPVGGVLLHVLSFYHRFEECAIFLFYDFDIVSPVVSCSQRWSYLQVPVYISPIISCNYLMRIKAVVSIKID